MYEQLMWGLNYDADRLSIGPTGGAWASRLLIASAGTAVGVGFILGGLDPGNARFNGIPVRNGDPLVVGGVTGILLVWLDAWRRLRQRIIATADTLSLRYGSFRSVSLGWDEVSDIYVGHHSDSRWDWSASPGSAGAAMRWVTDFDWPVVATANGPTINVDGLATLSASEGWGGEVSAATERVAILRRYGACCGLPLQSLLRRPSDRPWTPHWLRRTAVFAVATVMLVWTQV